MDIHARCRKLVLWAMKHALQLWARATCRGFTCLSLGGCVRDGLFVNSDMTVSCNCQDTDGSGQLGSLRERTLESLFAGPVAARLRRLLAAGRLPVTRCPACFYLRSAPRAAAEARAHDYRLPDGLSVENTVLCNLRCLGCSRQEILQTRRGGRTLTGDDLETVSRTLARLGARYCGYYNLGEPFLSPAILQELRTLRRHNPTMEILISTNGLLLDTDDKREAALLTDHVLFSLDGIDTAMVRRYQRGDNFDRAYDNLCALVALRNARGLTRPRIDWKYVVFRWNDHPDTIRRAIQLAHEAGVDCLQFTFARNPLYAISWRFFLSPFFQTLGEPQGRRFRIVRFAHPPHSDKNATPSCSESKGIEAAY